MIHNLALTLPAQSGDVSNVDRIAAAFVVHVANQRIQIVRTRGDLLSHGDVKRLGRGKIPTRAAHALGFQRETAAVSIVL